MDISKYISELLYEHDCVIIPGFGGFVCNYKPAEIHPIQHTISPPSKAISFNRNLRTNDGLLLNHIAKREQSSFDDAFVIVYAWVNSSNSLLQKGETIVVSKIGTFHNNIEGNLQFTADESVNYLKSSFGLRMITAEPVLRGKQVELTDRFEKHVAQIKPQRNIWRIAAAIFLVAALASVISLMQMGVEVKSLNLDEASVFNVVSSVFKTKDELISNYNKDVLSGKIPPSSTYPMTFTVKKAPANGGGDEYVITVNIAGKDYSSYALCKNDTLLFYRNKEVVQLPDGNGGSLGFTIQGPQKLPLSLKVGDKLPTFDDISVLYPQSFNTSHKVYVSEYYGSAGTALMEYQVAAKETFSLSSLSIHYMFAEVTAEEDVTVNGKTYKALVIESQTWTNSKMNVSVTTAYKDVNEWEKKGIDKMQANHDKMMKRKQFTNEQGYMVSYAKEWFVPSIGIVKSESYDNFGGIAGGTTTSGVE